MLSSTNLCLSFLFLISIPFHAHSRSTEDTLSPANINRLESIHFHVGYSKHGSGDMGGIAFGGEYSCLLRNKISLGFDLTGTINSSIHKIDVTGPGESYTDASVRFTTAGVQLGPVLNMHLLKTPVSLLNIGINVFGRYQSASNGSDGYSIYSPAATGLPVVLIGYDNRTPQHTFAIGGLLKLGYQVTLAGKKFMGLFAALQTDSNGDFIYMASLVFGKRY